MGKNKNRKKNRPAGGEAAAQTENCAASNSGSENGGSSRPSSPGVMSSQEMNGRDESMVNGLEQDVMQLDQQQEVTALLDEVEVVDGTMDRVEEAAPSSPAAKAQTPVKAESPAAKAQTPARPTAPVDTPPCDSPDSKSSEGTAGSSSPRSTRRHRMQCFLEAMVSDTLNRCPSWMRSALPSTQSLRKLNLRDYSPGATQGLSAAKKSALYCSAFACMIPVFILVVLAGLAMTVAGFSLAVVMTPVICMCTPFILTVVVVCCGGGMCLSGCALAFVSFLCTIAGVLLMTARHFARRVLLACGPAQGSVLHRLCSGVDTCGEKLNDMIWNRMDVVRRRFTGRAAPLAADE